MLTSLYSLLQSSLFTVAGIAGIGFIISFHELGHFLVAKMFGMRVQSFSIGFGPRLLKKVMGQTEFVISAIPLGGYVDLGNPDDKPNDRYSFAARPYYQKLMVMIGGITFNILLAYIIFCILFMTGMPQTRLLYPENATPTIEVIEKDSPAQKAGLHINDTILAINGIPLSNKAKKLIDELAPLAGQSARLTIERENTQQEVDITIGSRVCLGKSVGSLGVGFKLVPLAPQSIIQSIKRGIQMANQHIADTFAGFKYLLSSCDTTNLVGPVMLFSATIKGAAQGIKIFLIFLAIISINLAILNLIPLPILDGGQILFYTIEAVFRRSIPERVREYIFIATWIGFMLLTVYLIGQDIMRIAGAYITPVFKWVGLSK